MPSDGAAHTTEGLAVCADHFLTLLEESGAHHPCLNWCLQELHLDPVHPTDGLLLYTGIAYIQTSGCVAPHWALQQQCHGFFWPATALRRSKSS